MLTVTKKDLMEMGYGPSQSQDIIRRAKYLMIAKGCVYYSSKRLGRVPLTAVEEILGLSFEESSKGTVNG